MARRDIVPIDQIERRAPEAGRIRIGVKTARAMKSIDTFRFTSPHQALIEQLAQMYGGQAKPWDEPKARVKNQYEVVTTSNSIPVYLPANGLSAWYELWSGGGCQRRCDGVVVTTVEMHGDEAVPVESPCICIAKDKRECRPYTRLNVILPELPFAGTWRLETKGWNAAAELPGMFDMVRALHDSGQMVQARLGLESRSDVTGGKTRNFVVPTLSIEQSPLQIQAGQAAVGAISAAGEERSIAPPERLALEPAPVETEVIVPDEVTPPRTDTAGITEPQIRKMAVTFKELDITERQERLDYISAVVDRPVSSSKDLTKEEANRVISQLVALQESEQS